MREAIYRLINRQQWIDLAYDAGGRVPTGPVAAAIEAYQLTGGGHGEVLQAGPLSGEATARPRQLRHGSEWEIVVLKHERVERDGRRGLAAAACGGGHQDAYPR